MAQDDSSSGGIGAVSIVGMGMAAFASWSLNHSIGWACVHAIFGWFYMLYLCAGCGGGLPAELGF